MKEKGIVQTYTNYTICPAALDLQALQRFVACTDSCTEHTPGVVLMLSPDHVYHLRSCDPHPSKDSFEQGDNRFSEKLQKFLENSIWKRFCGGFTQQRTDIGQFITTFSNFLQKNIKVAPL